MLLKKFICYVVGYVNIIVEGYYIERFINKCALEKIFLWNMDRKGECLLETDISKNDFKKIKKICKKTNCKLKIKSKKGLPFKAHKYRKRKLFIILPVIFLIIMFILSRFIWNIEIIGNKNISTDELLKFINENGITVGMSKDKLNIDEVANKLRLERDDLSWVGIEVKGTNVIIEVVEASKKPEILDKYKYCDIISDKEGIIESINVKNGTGLVKKGDIIKKGDILVSGIMKGQYTGDRKVHATADIIARTWVVEEKRAPLSQNIEEKTGNEENYYEISINNFKINFNKSLSKFENYDTIKSSNRLKLFNNFYLPIEITKVTNIEMKSEQIDYNINDLKDKTISELKESLNKKTEGKNIVNENIITEEKNGFIEVKIIYEVLEKIGVEQKLEP